MAQHIIMIGNPVDGMNFIGPFNSRDKARVYAENHLDDEQWNITSLSSPEKDEEDEDEHDFEDDYWDRHSEYDDEEAMIRRTFADPGGNSALRAATKNNPRNLPCPTCERPNLLTPEDRRLGYQCDRCSDRAERGVDY